ncbi:MAG: hypothetical protein K0S86_1660 [Geminicoccaceae bacterium]|nr:hypothetical protein [Geminicoccaceae bacterium]
MSSALALASVTAVLKHVLENGLAKAGVTSEIGADTAVSAMSPDRITAGTDEKAQLNLFLYLVTANTSLRPGLGGTARPLALDLHYLLSAYGAQDFQAEILLGHALQLLHGTPVLDRERIRRTISSLSHGTKARVVPPTLAALAGSDVADRVERIEITPAFLPGDEMSKLWSAMQAKYRPSAAYRVSAVMINGGAGA